MKFQVMKKVQSLCAKLLKKFYNGVSAHDHSIFVYDPFPSAEQTLFVDGEEVKLELDPKNAEVLFEHLDWALPIEEEDLRALRKYITEQRDSFQELLDSLPEKSTVAEWPVNADDSDVKPGVPLHFSAIWSAEGEEGGALCPVSAEMQ